MKTTRVRVYRNLRKKCWSVMDMKTGRVIEHLKALGIEDVTFVVRPGGRAKVLRERRKNVHAFVVGVIRYRNGQQPSFVGAWDPVTYNPYAGPNFMYSEDVRCGGREGPPRAILSALHVKLDADGRAWVSRGMPKEFL